MQNLRQNFIVFKKPIKVEKVESFDKLQVTEFNIFCRNFAYFSYLTMSTKGCSGLFLFYLSLRKTRNFT